MSSRRSATPFLRRLLLSCAAAVMAVALPHGQGQPQGPSAASPADPYPNFDIRGYKDDPRLAGNEALAAYFAAVAPASPAAADALASSANGLAALRNDLPGAVVEADALGGAAIVSAMPGSPFLSGPSGDRVATLRAFVQSHAAAYGIAGDAASLVVVADEMNPAGNMAWVEFEQRLHGIPVFQGHLRGAFTAKGELARTNGLLATGAEAVAPQAADLSATQAVAIAAANVGLPAGDIKEASRDGNIVHFARGVMADEPDARLVYFPLAPGVVRLAWQTQVFGDPQAFMTVVDASTGTILFRKSLTDFQTQAATYSVYTGDSPAPGTPSSSRPDATVQAPYVGRTNATLIGNEAPNTFNNNGWITDGTGGTNGETQGNNVEAGLDRDANNIIDATVTGVNRVFTATYAPGTDDPLGAQHQRGSVIDMFYWVNRYHDETYRLGFTEAFRNFQNDNFGRGGSGLDRISAEGQDGSGTNNANFSTPADGGRGRMQMYLWTGPTPDLDGTIDHEIVIHELTHGLSNRLHANSSGLANNMGRGMGEGWGDFYARALLSDPSEPLNGIYAMGGWATHLGAASYTANYYYGIRRFPYAPIAFTGGPGNRPHNPLTFADVDSTQDNLTDGAYPRGPFGVLAVDGVHNMGEVWASMLFEVRLRFITRLGFVEGNRRILQFVTDGMKGNPVNPTFLTSRDSILAAANIGGTAADVADIWAGFAVRGLGVTASIENAGSGADNTRVTESFLRPGDPVPTFTINDITANEGNSGATNFTFTVTLSNPSTNTPTVVYSTANGTATTLGTSPVGTSTGPVALPSGAPTTTSGSAAPYPATVAVAGLTGTITRAAVRLNGLTHTFPGDLDMLLVGPGGQRAMFMSDVGDGGDVSNLTLTFEDGAPAPATSQLVAGTYGPTDLSPGDAMAAPAPAGPYGATFATFNGTNPNGTWQLFIVDDAGSDTGSLASFTLLLSTTTSAGGDYSQATGTLTFPPGTTTRTITVPVVADTVPEPSETFFVNLASPLGAAVGDGQGIGIINNDDGAIPTATNDTYTTAINTPLTVPAPGVLVNDNPNGLGALSVVLVSPPSNGGLTLAGTGGGFTYTPNAGFSGSDSFVYYAQAAGGASSNVATVTLTVSAVTTVQPALNFYVANVVGNRVTLRWTTPPAGPAPTSYVLEGGVTPGGVIATIPLGPLPLFTFDAPTGAFYVRLRSVQGANVSGVSNEVPLFVNVPASPSAPANLLGLVNGSSLSLQWRNTFGGGAAAGAILDVSGPATLSMPLGATETFSFAGVPSGTYNLSVRSANAGGSSAASNVVTLTFPNGCTGAPSAPSRFLAYASGATLNLVWESPTSGAAATSYVIDATGSITISVPVGGTSLSSPVPSGTYNLSVRAVNACGSSAATAVQTVTIP